MRPNPYEGRTILQSASATRTGGAIARYFLANGARVYLNYYTNDQGALALAKEFGKERAIPLQGDVTDPESVAQLFAQIKARKTGLDGLVNVVGDYHEQPILETSYEDYKKNLTNNLDSVFLMCKAAHPFLKGSASPRIVNFGYAMGDRVTSAKAWAYHVAKMGVISLTKSMAKQWGPDGISVNVISPGTLANSIVMESESPEDYIPQGRFGEYSDLWPVFDLIFRADSTYQTGNNFVISGGYAL